MPPAAKNLFEKRFLDFQKLLIITTTGFITLIARSWLFAAWEEYT